MTRLQGAQSSFVAAVLAFTRSVSQENLCWRGGFDAERCCGKRDPDCWDAVFTEARCCPRPVASAGKVAPTSITVGLGMSSSAGRGDPSCWQDGYTYEVCCATESPKEGCWDSEFGPERCCAEDPAVNLDGPIDVTALEMTEAFLRRTASAADSPLGCDDTPPGLWRIVKMASVVMNVSRQYGMPGERPSDADMALIVRHVLAWTRDKRSWEAAKAACTPGVLNAIDLAAAHIDKEVGEEDARRVYELHQSLQRELVVGNGVAAAADWPTLYEGLEHVPRLLGLLEPHACHGTSLRIYVYRIGKLSHMTRPVLTCSQKMSQCAASVHIHRWLENGGCVTEDPNEADLFYFPAYEACYNETACGFGNDTERCFPPGFDPAADLPFFERRRGSDHIFVYGCNLLPWRDPLMIQSRRSIVVTVESFQAENVAGPNMLAWLSHSKDVLIPGYVPPWRISAMLAFNRPMIKRRILVAFHGHSARSPNVGHMYDRSPLAEVRSHAIEYFWNLSDCSVGPPVRDYFRRMGMSRFCLVPAGLTAWTIHLYEAFFLGCVPVILSDELTVPFQQEIDWPSLSLQVPASIPMAELHAKLSMFSLGRLKAMYRGLTAARCWFDYARGWGNEGGEEGCSPYKGFVRGLEMRSLAMHGRGLYDLPRYWEPPPRT